MKKVVILACSFVMMLCLAGCGSSNSSQPQAMQDVEVPGLQAKVPADWTVNLGSYNDDARGYFQYVSPDESQSTLFYYEQLQGAPMTIDELLETDKQSAIDSYAATDYSCKEIGRYDLGGTTAVAYEIGYKCNENSEAERMDTIKAYAVTDGSIYTIETIGDKAIFDGVMETVQLQ
ncbi:MAG: hypothetical protein V8R08_06530 [Coriobacteriales bacterium]